MFSFALPRSFVFRLTLVFGAVVTLSMAALLALAYTVTVDALSQQLDNDVGAELDSLTSEASINDESNFVGEIKTRADALNKSQFVYALFDAKGHRIAGTALDAPPAEGWSTIKVSDARSRYMIRLRSTHLQNGMSLTVGATTDRVQSVKTFFVRTIPAGVGAALLLAFAGAMFLSHRFWQRIDRLNEVCRTIMAGNLSVRAQIAGSGDEIDTIAGSMNAMLDRIGALMESMRQVTTDVAHDLRTPLARLRQGLERSTLREQSPAGYREAVGAAIGEADAILDTFSAMLKIAEAESGSPRQTFTDVDLSAVVTRVAEAYEADAEARNQHVTAAIEPNVTVRGDASLLTQMTANLVENALRHCPPETKVSLSLTTASGRPVLVVADNGPGIPPEDRDRVLGRFVRLERSRTTPGSGLGLSLAAAVAELHQVRLTLADNNPGLRCEIAF